MKMLFLKEYCNYEPGDIVDMSEDNAKAFQNAGYAQPYIEPESEPVKVQTKPKRSK